MTCMSYKVTTSLLETLPRHNLAVVIWLRHLLMRAMTKIKLCMKWSSPLKSGGRHVQHMSICLISDIWHFFYRKSYFYVCFWSFSLHFLTTYKQKNVVQCLGHSLWTLQSMTEKNVHVFKALLACIKRLSAWLTCCLNVNWNLLSMYQLKADYVQ